MASEKKFGQLPEWVSKALELRDEVRKTKQLADSENAKTKISSKNVGTYSKKSTKVEVKSDPEKKKGSQVSMFEVKK